MTIHMKAIKPKIQYYFLLLPVPWICMVAFYNYMYIWKDRKQALKTVLIIVVFGIIYTIIPVYLTALWGIPDIMSSRYQLLYIYLLGTPFSIYIILRQQKYINEMDTQFSFEEDYFIAKNNNKENKLFYKDIGKVVFIKNEWQSKHIELFEVGKDKPFCSLGLIAYSDEDIKNILTNLLSHAPDVPIKTPITWKYHKYFK